MLQNVEIIVADISMFEMDASYDRIFSIEMFEVGLCASCHADHLYEGVILIYTYR